MEKVTSQDIQNLYEYEGSGGIAEMVNSLRARIKELELAIAEAREHGEWQGDEIKRLKDLLDGVTCDECATDLADCECEDV